MLRDGLPMQRNGLAHGGSYLKPQVRGTLELVAEMLNQLFAQPAAAETAADQRAKA